MLKKLLSLIVVVAASQLSQSSENLMVDETQNPGEPHRCTSDDQCSGSRICGSVGWCMDPSSVPSPETALLQEAVGVPSPEAAPQMIDPVPSFDLATLNALPRIIELVLNRKKEACETVSYMEQKAQDTPDLQSNEGFVMRFNNWKQICERREGVLNVFAHGTVQEQLDTLKRISNDSTVANIIEDEKKKLEDSADAKFLDSWDAPL